MSLEDRVRSTGSLLAKEEPTGRASLQTVKQEQVRTSIASGSLKAEESDQQLTLDEMQRDLEETVTAEEDTTKYTESEGIETLMREDASQIPFFTPQGRDDSTFETEALRRKSLASAKSQDEISRQSYVPSRKPTLEQEKSQDEISRHSYVPSRKQTLEQEKSQDEISRHSYVASRKQTLEQEKSQDEISRHSYVPSRKQTLEQEKSQDEISRHSYVPSRKQTLEQERKSQDEISRHSYVASRKQTLEQEKSQDEISRHSYAASRKQTLEQEKSQDEISRHSYVASRKQTLEQEKSQDEISRHSYVASRKQTLEQERKSQDEISRHSYVPSRKQTLEQQDSQFLPHGSLVPSTEEPHMHEDRTFDQVVHHGRSSIDADIFDDVIGQEKTFDVHQHLADDTEKDTDVLKGGYSEVQDTVQVLQSELDDTIKVTQGSSIVGITEDQLSGYDAQELPTAVEEIEKQIYQQDIFDKISAAEELMSEHEDQFDQQVEAEDGQDQLSGIDAQEFPAAEEQFGEVDEQGHQEEIFDKDSAAEERTSEHDDQFDQQVEVEDGQDQLSGIDAQEFPGAKEQFGEVDEQSHKQEIFDEESAAEQHMSKHEDQFDQEVEIEDGQDQLIEIDAQEFPTAEEQFEEVDEQGHQQEIFNKDSAAEERTSEHENQFDQQVEVENGQDQLIEIDAQEFPGAEEQFGEADEQGHQEEIFDKDSAAEERTSEHEDQFNQQVEVEDGQDQLSGIDAQEFPAAEKQFGEADEQGYQEEVFDKDSAAEERMSEHEDKFNQQVAFEAGEEHTFQQHEFEAAPTDEEQSFPQDDFINQFDQVRLLFVAD